MLTIETTIKIHANANTVWRILTDFEQYPLWNTVFKSIEGEAKTGNTLINRMYTKNGNHMTFKPIVLEAIPNQSLRWLGRLLIPGLFDGEHQFLIQSTNVNNITLIHRETFSGIFAALTQKKLIKDIKPTFERFNQELKLRSEHSEPRQD